jgi:hypothetical protein
MQFTIKYGTIINNIDVTQVALQKCCVHGIICIPANDDTRARFFTDPIYGTLKVIIVTFPGGQKIFNHDQIAWIDATKGTILKVQSIITLAEGQKKLHGFQNRLKIRHGSFQEEYPEQLLSARFLNGSEKVLEFGGNIGRNSMIISSILKNAQNLVTLECDTVISRQLQENRDINGLHFHIEPSALSKQKLIQNGWTTKPSETIPEGYTSVQILTYDQLKIKYPINFDTLVADCEGALYYIIKDMPTILEGIKLLIVENDYLDIEHKNYVDQILHDHGMTCVYSQGGGWGCCADNFFEVWEKYC